MSAVKYSMNTNITFYGNKVYIIAVIKIVEHHNTLTLYKDSWFAQSVNQNMLFGSRNQAFI